ncbi:MAG: hypothetical protein ABIJ43_05940 [Candidatus Beckwithbacteria bacterium]
MEKTRIYTKHQAFNIVYKELKKNPNRAGGFEAPKKYHYAPKKLDIFTDFTHYTRWSNELHSYSTRLISSLRNLYGKSRDTSSLWYKNKNKLNSILKKFDLLKLDIEDLYDDIFEFQNCMLATHIGERNASINALSNQVWYLTTLENKIIETCNRKLYEISSSRLSYTNLFIALVALLVSLLSLYYSNIFLKSEVSSKTQKQPIFKSYPFSYFKHSQYFMIQGRV